MKIAITTLLKAPSLKISKKAMAHPTQKNDCNTEISKHIKISIEQLESKSLKNI